MPVALPMNSFPSRKSPSSLILIERQQHSNMARADAKCILLSQSQGKSFGTDLNFLIFSSLAETILILFPNS